MPEFSIPIATWFLDSDIAISSEGTEAVDGAGRADDQHVEESVLPNRGAEGQVDVEDESNASAEGVQRCESLLPTCRRSRRFVSTRRPCAVSELVRRVRQGICQRAAAPPPRRSEWVDSPSDPHGLCMSYREGVFKVSKLSEEERKHAVRVLVVYCVGSRSPFMHVVPSKATSMDKFAA